MGSLVPFQDLNLLPEPPRTSTSTSIALKIPKIEPKLEQFEETLETHQPLEPELPQEQFLLDSTPDIFSNFQHSPLPAPTPTHTQFQPSLSQSSAIPSDEQHNVYSEYNRISELFRSTFANRSQQFGDVSALDSDSGAIVPVPDENCLSTVVVSRRPRFQQRSSELVRVTNLGLEDQRYFRDIVRRTRMIYDSLRISSVMEGGKQIEGKQNEAKQNEAAKQSEEKQSEVGKESEPGKIRRPRGDLIASSLMRERGLWLNRDKRIVGAIPGVYIGDLFFFRMELCVVGLHGQIQAGIDYLPASQSANGEPIATSIIVSGGYEDDEDSGDAIIYTGHGGQDKFSKQCVNQKLEGGNLALERSMHYGIEVRVIRGIKYEGSITSKVYVYDGLYKIIDCWFDVGKSGFGVYKYKLLRIEGQEEMGSAILRFAENLRASALTVRPMGYLSLDISMKKESVPVFLFNDIDSDHDPMYYDYLARTVFPPFVFQGSGSGCECVYGCNDDCLCALKNGGELAYDHHGTLLRGKPLIFECGAHCQCPPSCRNRVTQKGLRNRLEVFRSRETGWGVRSLNLIRAGGFICEYAGVALTREQAQIFTMNGDSLIYPGRFAEKWTDWGDLSQIFSDYQRPSYPAMPPLDFAMDVSRMRNVACYISHSTTPNVMVQFVLYDHNNLLFPHLMLFALENIPPLRELSLDYGVADEWTGKLSICN